MNEQSNNQNASEQTDTAVEAEAGKVHIQPSEPESDFPAGGGEENAPGRTPGKAEGSSEIFEADLESEKVKLC